MKKFKETKTYYKDYLLFEKGIILTSFYDTNDRMIGYTTCTDISVKYDINNKPVLVLYNNSNGIIMFSYNDNGQTTNMYTANIDHEKAVEQITEITKYDDNDRLSNIVGNVYKNGEKNILNKTCKIIGDKIYSDSISPNRIAKSISDLNNNLLRLEYDSTITEYEYDDNGYMIKRKETNKISGDYKELLIEYIDNYKYSISGKYKYELNENGDEISMTNKDTGELIWTCEYEYYEE